jgi:hypothetical protein
MAPRAMRRNGRAWVLGLAASCVLWGAAPGAWAGLRRVDPAEVVPLDQIAPGRRDSVAEVIRDHTFQRQGKPDTFPCHPRLYLALLNEPALTLALWQDLSTNPARLRQVGPNRYQGTDGSGTTATWEFVLRSPRLHVLHCDLEYLGPRGNARLNGRIVLVVHSGFFREGNGDYWIKHDVQAYVKIDSRGWKAVAATVRPLLEKLLEDQVQEAGWFVSLMGRLVETYPNWATQIALKQEHIPLEARTAFRDLVAQTRRPGAQAGRPVLVDNAEATAVKTR